MLLGESERVLVRFLRENHSLSRSLELPLGEVEVVLLKVVSPFTLLVTPNLDPRAVPKLGKCCKVCHIR